MHGNYQRSIGRRIFWQAFHFLLILLVFWLLFGGASINEMVFSQFMVNIKDNSLTGAAKGEHLDPEKHKIKTEVKAATYSQLKVEEKDGLFVVRCVVDV